MRTPHLTSTYLAAALLLLPGVECGLAGEARPAADAASVAFDRDVRPILARKCFKCHGESKQRGGLRLDSRAAILAGGDSGPAVVPGKPEESLLIEAVRYETIEMPPAGRLSGREIQALVKWVERGMSWPGSPAGQKAASARPDDDRTGGPDAQFGDEDRSWWAFQPVREPAVPASPDDRWSRNSIDRFVRRALTASGLTPASEADRATLIRRASFDVIGLPPTPAETAAFLADTSPNAYERVIDRLLASRHYGERWARHWLDLVRYADSDGYRLDHYRPTAWLYRDYVIRSLNDDKPYDRFVREQVAGDELDPDNPDALIATGYLRHGIYESNNLDVQGQWSLILNDITDTTGDVFLGLGIQCARCHDHKFDPILQKDYYRLQSFFASILPRDDRPAATPERIRLYREKLAAWESKTAGPREEIATIEASYRRKASAEAIAGFPDDIEAILKKPAGERTPLERQVASLAQRRVLSYVLGKLEAWIKGEDKARIQALRAKIAAFDREKPGPLPTPMTVIDVGPEASPVFLPNKRRPEPIAPGFLTILDPEPAEIRPLPNAPRSTGRRTALARWLTRPENPLSTRVIVNRVWQYHFGRGLTATPSDLGRLGELPSHPKLLDWLTARFVKEGWSLKRLHRLILTSATYRQSAVHPRSAAYRVKDPENRLYWRGNTRRLAAEQIRDAVLAVTGELDLAAGGPSVESSVPRRSVYTRMMRNDRDPLLDAFDLPCFFSSNSARDTTTTPLQSLFLLNSQAMLVRARAFAARLERESASGEGGMVEAAYRLAFGRGPRPAETAAALRFLREQASRVDPGEAARADAGFLPGSIPTGEGQAALFSPGGPQRRLDVPHRDPLNTGDFTLEATFLIRSVPDGDGMRTVVAKWDGDEKRPGWSLGITGHGTRRTPRTLVLQLVGTRNLGGFGEETLLADQPIQLNRPYYAAVAVRLAAQGPGIVTFYLKDLLDEGKPLRVARVPHGITGGFDNALPLSIGGRTGAAECGFDGLIDEVRLTDVPLGVDDLLLTAETHNPHTLGYWRFETDPGVFRDSTGHGLDLRLPGRPANRLDVRRSSLAGFCHVLLNSSEFLYVD